MENFFKKDIIKKSNNYIKNLFKYFENTHFFHNYNHSLQVAKRAFELGKLQNLDNKDLELLVIAGLFHDSGFLVEYDNNEIYGAKIAEIFLKNISYPNKKIEIIKNIILATILERKPSNILEEIIKDADLDNLGRDDFFGKSDDLKKEIETVKNIQIDDLSWKYGILELIKNYKFFTQAQIKQREEKRKQNTLKLKKSLSIYL